MDRQSIARNTIVYNAAIQACADGGAWSHALTLFDRMASEDVARDRHTYNTVVRCLEAGGEYKLASDLRMEEAARTEATKNRR